MEVKDLTLPTKVLGLKPAVLRWPGHASKPVMESINPAVNDRINTPQSMIQNKIRHPHQH